MYNNCKNFTLEDDGVEVVENVLTVDEISTLQDKMWEWLNFKTKYTSKPIIRKNPLTYVSIFELFPKHGMLFQHWDFGHNPLSWSIRQNKNVIAKFSSIWGTDDLLTSFDGISVSLPCEMTKRGWNRGKEWFHSDQCFKRNTFECAQGLVNLFDVCDGDGTLRVLKGSHKLHGAFQEKFKITDSSDWCLLNEEQKQFYVDRLDVNSDICVKAPAGSLVLWDSRTIHQGMEPQKGRKEHNIRCVPYVCMTPASLASQSQLKKRVKYFEERRTCNHWPHKIKVFGKTPRTYGQSVPRVDNDILEETELMKKLVGYHSLK
jgi:hypothetical protein